MAIRPSLAFSGRPRLKSEAPLRLCWGGRPCPTACHSPSVGPLPNSGDSQLPAIWSPPAAPLLCGVSDSHSARWLQSLPAARASHFAHFAHPPPAALSPVPLVAHTHKTCIQAHDLLTLFSPISRPSSRHHQSGLLSQTLLLSLFASCLATRI